MRSIKPAQLQQPTLWRTCRVLANRQRLRIIELLASESELMVTAVARHLALPVPVASQYLRALEARGFLHARRRASRVFYRLQPLGAAGPLQPLLKALRLGFRSDPGFPERAFRCATAFTHPRRIEIYRGLLAGIGTSDRLRALTKVSRFAMARHLGKLESRGFIRHQDGQWVVLPATDALAGALGCLAEG